jgi:hypothetical protein
MTTTDMAVCWTVHRAHKNKAHVWVRNSLAREKAELPLRSERNPYRLRQRVHQ